MGHSRRGFTLIEMLMVIVILGIVATIAMPKITHASRRLTVQSAQQEVASYLSTARAAAIRTGRTARFIRLGNTISVAVDTGAVVLDYVRLTDLNTDHGVTVTMPTNPDTIRFDPRGMAVGINGTLTIVLTKQGISDSVCVIGRGRIATRDCQL